MRLMDGVTLRDVAKTAGVLGAWLAVASMLSGCIVGGYSRMGGGGMGGWFLWPGGMMLVLVVVVALVLLRRR